MPSSPLAHRSRMPRANPLQGKWRDELNPARLFLSEIRMKGQVLGRIFLAKHSRELP
jgi:hypothetical protein